MLLIKRVGGTRNKMVHLSRLVEEREYNDIVYASDYWRIKIPQSQNDELATRIKKLIDEGNINWSGVLNQEIISRMNLIKVKDVGVLAEKVEFSETVQAVFDRFLADNNIDTTSAQQKLEMPGE